MKDGFYKVRFRHPDGWPLHPCDELVEGKIFHFTANHRIIEGRLRGEIAMKAYKDYPESGPAWIASGDLEPADEPVESLVS